MKKAITIFLIIIMGILFANFANASTDCNITSPTILSQGTKLNVTFNVTGWAGNVSAFVEGRSLATANSSFSFVLNETNTSERRHIEIPIGSFDNITLEDATDWEFRATCYVNASCSTCGSLDASESGQVSTSITGRILDRTNPDTPTSLTTAKRANGDTITATVNGTETTQCSISFGLGAIRSAMTHSGNSCTFTVGASNPPDGIYQYQIFATDGRNETSSSVTEIEIDALSNPSRRSPSSLERSKLSQATAGKFSQMPNKQRILGIAILFVVADLLFGLGIIFKK